jgi:hypothetical protein
VFAAVAPPAAAPNAALMHYHPGAVLSTQSLARPTVPAEITRALLNLISNGLAATKRK